MLPNAAVARTFADHLVLVGGIPADRVRADPSPGSATIEDWIAATDRGESCELVDGTLVHRPFEILGSDACLLADDILPKFKMLVSDLFDEVDGIKTTNDKACTTWRKAFH